MLFFLNRQNTYMGISILLDTFFFIMIFNAFT